MKKRLGEGGDSFGVGGGGEEERGNEEENGGYEEERPQFVDDRRGHFDGIPVPAGFFS